MITLPMIVSPVALAALVVFGSAPSVIAQAPPAGSVPAPAIRCAPQALDLGEMTPGQPKSAPFTVRNNGPEPFVVESVKGGCGCTTVTAPPKGPIAPGESFTVQVTVDPGKRGGIDLVKPLYVAYVGGSVESVQIKGRVRLVASVVPSVIEAVDAVSATARIAVESVDGQRFRVTGVTPAGVAELPRSTLPAERFELAFSIAGWERAGRPASLVIATDLPGASELVVPIRSAPSVSMFRIPAATGDAAVAGRVQEEQSAIIREIDAALPARELSSQFRMRLHREAGMLFVHGTDGDLQLVRDAVRKLPAAMGVRESRPTPGS